MLVEMLGPDLHQLVSPVSHPLWCLIVLLSGEKRQRAVRPLPRKRAQLPERNTTIQEHAEGTEGSLFLSPEKRGVDANNIPKRRKPGKTGNLPRGFLNVADTMTISDTDHSCAHCAVCICARDKRFDPARRQLYHTDHPHLSNEESEQTKRHAGIRLTGCV